MHTPINFYYDKSPRDLYRSGNSTSPRMDHVRLSPPRLEEESHEVKVYPGKDGQLWVDHRSGGLSLFDAPSNRPGVKWWKLPADTPISAGLLLTEDIHHHASTDTRKHYTLRPAYDMPLKTYVALLISMGHYAFAMCEQKNTRTA